MSQKQFDYLVFIGRFQPFHVGHQEVLDKALQLADKVIVLVGSANQPRTIKNPFSFAERRQMILNTYGFNNLKGDEDKHDYKRIAVEPLSDNKYNDTAWAASVQSIVSSHIAVMGWSDKPRRGGIIGHVKDSSSYYLNLFPQWELVDHAINEEVHATDIRKIMFTGQNLRFLQAVVPYTVFAFLEKFSNTADAAALFKEQIFIDTYRRSWAAAPYAPTFLTCDAVVVQSGHILLIKRKAEPGKGLYALPGGFVNQNERIEDGMLRELREETKLKVPEPVLRGSIKAKEVFDHPDRSLRGRTVTQAFYIELQPGKLPPVKGGDDAAQARWIPLAHVREEELFEDHYSIIKHFVGEMK
jgi:bifunctional NMN adenylyltransferase/nudix hydrolase